MKDENIVRYTREDLPPDNETDLKRIKSLTEKEIQQAALSDPDAQPTTEEFLNGAKIVVPVSLDQETFKWYQTQGKNVEDALSTALEEYKESHLSP